MMRKGARSGREVDRAVRRQDRARMQRSRSWRRRQVGEAIGQGGVRRGRRRN
jgi:hypothetical protein